MSQNLLKIVPKSDAVLTFVLPNRCEYPPFAKTGILGQTWEQEKKVPPGEYNFLVDFGTPSGTHFRSKMQKKTLIFHFFLNTIFDDFWLILTHFWHPKLMIFDQISENSDFVKIDTPMVKKQHF